MASVGPQNPTASAQYGGGSTSWSDDANTYASDNAKASAGLGSPFPDTLELVDTGFNFSAIPGGATINGIKVEVEKSISSTSGNIHDAEVYLTKDGINPVGSNYAVGTTWPTTDAYSTYGGPTDLWGTTWSLSEIQASTFGAMVAAVGSGGKWGATAYIDHVRITVYYTGGGGGGAVSSNLLLLGCGA